MQRGLVDERLGPRRCKAGCKQTALVCRLAIHSTGNLLYHPSLPSQAEALQAQVDQLAAEKAAAFDARVQAESRLSALEAELADACAEIEQAKRTGTPKGGHSLAGCSSEVAVMWPTNLLLDMLSGCQVTLLIECLPYAALSHRGSGQGGVPAGTAARQG